MAIKAVEMTRKIRDASHKRTSSMSKEEKLRLIHEEATRFLQTMEKSGTNITGDRRTASASRNTLP